MTKSVINNHQICACAVTIALLSSKWKVLIMRDLLNGTHRFNELKKSIQGISQKMLTQSLKEMAADGLIKRHVFPEVPPKVEYSLTQTGESLRPVIDSLNQWGTHYLQNSDPQFLKKRFDINLPKNRWMKISQPLDNTNH